MSPNPAPVSIARLTRTGQRGQVMVLAAVAAAGIIAASALAIDFVRVYYEYQSLTAATQAAALAGATDLSNGDSASGAENVATSYSALSGRANAVANLPGVTMVSGYPKVECLSSLGTICSAYTANANAIAVSESASIPMIFLNLIGISSIPIRVTATAAAGGGNNSPYNVAMVLDTTQSMNSIDSDSQCNTTRISCALSGIRTLLGTLSPCAAGLSSCGSASGGTLTMGANVANPVDEVALFAFPGLTAASQATKDYICPTSNPSTTSYNNSPAYQIIPLSSDYRSSNTAASLNSGSYLVTAAGGGSCSGVQAPGGQGTFYAGVIDAAQATLVANARPNTQNVMIILSDGDANASSSQMTNKNTPYSQTQQCHQAVARAQAAAAAGTIIYTVAYGSGASGCSTDTHPNITPCQTMEQMASAPQNFFSDYTASGGTNSCVSAARPTSNLKQIFQQIGVSLTLARLIPNNTP
jgi:Putative Tad-like Flp pilus-assembly